jgi:hypothetical protein
MAELKKEKLDRQGKTAPPRHYNQEETSAKPAGIAMVH